ncbi:MAG TPA: hypothetical protein VLH79_05990 [Chthonomonadales bacterium]|nr:hypothetical protein [Chthonomonadales bacterium]
MGTGFLGLRRADLMRVGALGVVVACANVLDLLTTYCASPTLVHEWNVLHRKLGLGWPGLIGAKLVGGACAVAGYAFYLRHRHACYPVAGLGLSAFGRAFLLGSPTAGVHARRILVTLGYLWAAMQALVAWVAIDNLLIYFGYSPPFRGLDPMAYHLSQGMLISGAALWRMVVANHAEYVQLPAHAVTFARAGHVPADARQSAPSA